VIKRWHFTPWVTKKHATILLSIPLSMFFWLTLYIFITLSKVHSLLATYFYSYVHLLAQNRKCKTAGKLSVTSDIHRHPFITNRRSSSSASAKLDASLFVDRRYRVDHLIPASDVAPRRRRLRSANLNHLTVPRCRLKPNADADATKLSSCVVSAVWTQSWPSLQFPVLTSDDIMTSLLKKL